ncbi:MAG TPA: cystathionine beta-lyase, partial [Tissierellaceae bacterium]|nr:cystathionine beta-lyase [Tissierellaceae bacterium]
MKYNFDQILNRKDSNSIKWNIPRMEYGDEDILPMWVADMDFKVADEILNALKGPIDHGVIGYELMPDSFYKSIIDWLYKKYNWKIEKEWISYIPGVVPGISVATNEFTEEKDEILIQPPVYHPFYRVAENNNRQIVENPLKFDGEKYEM